ncbi:MAG: antibiotic biosynthesis monooxygenase family protein [Pseudomonadota bacterium]
MIAVIFEVWPKDGHREGYLRRAAALKAHLSDSSGFVSVERFESLAEPGKLLSLSFWEDEAALEQWRRLPDGAGVHSGVRDKPDGGPGSVLRLRHTCERTDDVTVDAARYYRIRKFRYRAKASTSGSSD